MAGAVYLARVAKNPAFHSHQNYPALFSIGNFIGRCQLNINVDASVSVSTNVFPNDLVTIQPDQQLFPGVSYRITVGNQVQNDANCGTQNQGFRVYSTFTVAP